jgi:lysophospholipase L1-like esterase
VNNAHSVASAPPRRGARRWIFRIATPILALLLLFVGLEIAFRIAGVPSVHGPILRESYENAAAADNYRNALGLRERWGEVPGDENSIRIAFLGDSITYGAGVEQEQGFVHLIEGLLNDGKPLRYVTINLGEPGTDPVDQVEVYQRVRRAVRPDVLVHVLYCNDLGRDLYEDLKFIHALQFRKSWPATYSHVWRYFERRVRYEMVFQRTVDYFRGGDSPFKRERAWQRLTDAVRKVKAMAEADGARYVMVMWPWLARLDDYPLEDVHRRMRRVAEQLDVPFFDLLGTFRGRNARRMRLSIIDEHPSPEGHRLGALALAEYLRGSGILDGAEP